MKTKTALVLGSSLLVSAVLKAQQSPNPNPAPTPPPQSQATARPCGTLTPLTKHVHFKPPAWLQKELAKQQARIGGTVDIGGVIQDATRPKPCAPVTSAPAPGVTPTPITPKP